GLHKTSFHQPFGQNAGGIGSRPGLQKARQPLQNATTAPEDLMDILVIDDEVSLRRTLRTTLESMGHTVAEAASSDRALRQRQKPVFDLAVLDLRLGREAGLDLLPELLRGAPGLAVVVATAFASIGSAVEAMRRGAFDYLPKPFTPDQL